MSAERPDLAWWSDWLARRPERGQTRVLVEARLLRDLLSHAIAVEAERDGYRQLATDLAAELERVTRHPQRTHPGFPAVSYQHFRESYHDDLLALLARARTELSES